MLSRRMSLMLGVDAIFYKIRLNGLAAKEYRVHVLQADS